MKKVLFTIILTSIVGFVFAETPATEPDAPSFELPPVFVEVEDQTEDSVETDLPEIGGVELPEFEVELPEPENFMLSDAAFAVEISDPDVDKSLEGKPKKDYFFDGTAGLGSLLNLTGSFKVTKRGDTPNFDLEIKHDSFGIFDYTNPVGSGFNFRDTSAGFNFSYKGDNLEEGFTFFYRDRNVGFQGQSANYSSITDRFFDFSNNFSVVKLEQADFLFLLDFNLLNTTLEGVTPINYLNMFFSPAFRVESEFDTIKLNFETRYNFISDGATANFHDLAVLLDFDAELPKAVNLGFGVGFNWNDHNINSIYGVDLLGFTFPFYLKLHGSGSTFLKYHFEGGFKNEIQKLSDIKKDEIWIASGNLFAKHGWYCLADLRWSIARKANIQTGLEFERINGIVTSNFSAENGQGLYTISQGQLDLIYITLGFDVMPVKEVLLGLKWKGNVMPNNTFYLIPEHELTFVLDFDLEDIGLGGGFDFTFQTFGNNDIRMPIIGLDLYYMVTDNIKVKFEMVDLIAPAFADERKSRGIYRDPGLNIRLLMEFSL
ncbi:MAG: hypothetical protein JXR63_03655 [Spirochaetales bacterium]|nr:hypothetical protein [Spirochaetales bacterium]